MFLDDMCASFSIDYSLFSQTDGDFFIVKPHDSKLKQLLEYDNFQFLRYDFSQLISKNMYGLLLDGVCHVEMVIGFEDDELKAIQFISVDSTRFRKSKKEMKFYAVNCEGKRVRWTVPNQFIIRLDLRDLKTRRNHFRKMLRALPKEVIPELEWLNRTGVPFADFQNRQVLKALRDVRDTYWDMRNRDNEYINEIYLLYRKVMYDSCRFKFFEYVLSQYNKALREIGLEYGFSGEIAYSVNISCYR